ncbi:MAG TPA: class II fumarate hydratase [Candidatus Limnocylindrales bacterium]|nr:class II fumarate hydratase [Candidatus Limnocylindrales bacterium]
MDERIEKDSLGEVRVPEDALWGAQTQRAVANFPVSGRTFPRIFLEALARVKRACATAHPGLDDAIRRDIVAACTRIIAGEFDSQFPVDVFQTGSGTSTNMNMNEVIANICNPSRGVYAPVHPNDHVNIGQSSNDVIPTAAHVAALVAIRRELLPSLGRLHASLSAKAGEFDAIVKPGRTHLMEAVPVRLGQVIGGYARQVEKRAGEIDRASHALEELAIGGTATGTGLNAPAGFGKRVAALLSQELGFALREASNHFEAQAARDDMVTVSGALRVAAVALAKIAGDIRLLAMLGEVVIPDLQPGSSIMPGKVNPVMCEMLIQVCAQVEGNDLVVALGGQGGQFELNAMIPVMTANLLDSIALMASSCSLFAERCIDGLAADARRSAETLDKSPLAATALAPKIGYERAAELAKQARAHGASIKALAIEQNLVTADEAERLFDFRHLTERADEDSPK